MPRFNGNDPQRHRGFLRALRGAGDLSLEPRFCTGADRHYESPPKRRPSFDEFLDGLVQDCEVGILVDDEQSYIQLDIDHSLIPGMPQFRWRATYVLPYTPATRDLVRAAARRHYDDDLTQLF